MIRPGHLSIRTRLVLMIFLVTAVALGIGFSIILVSQSRMLQREVAEHALLQARLVGENCVAPLEFGYASDAEEALRKFKALPAVSGAVVFDRTGSVFAIYGEPGAVNLTRPAESANPVAFGKNDLVVTTPILHRGQTFGTLRVRTSTQELQGHIREAQGLFLLLALGLGALALLAAHFLQKSISQPILDLANVAQRISKENDYSVRLGSRREDEIGTLYRAFEQMLGRISVKEEALQRSEAHFRRVIETTAQGFLLVDLDGRTRDCNQALLDMLGYDRDAFLATSPLNYLDAQSVEVVRKIFARRDTQEQYTFEIVFNRKDGTPLQVHCNATNLRDEHGELQGSFAMITDLTERLRSEQMRAEKETAEAAARSKSEFLANMSHEIRTPMNAVLGFAGLALRQDLSPKVHNYLQKIHTSGQSLLGIINDILDFSKIEAGRLEMETMPFRLSEVLRNVVDLFAQKASESGLELTVAVGEGVPDDLMGDPLRLSQILINLTGNALKFTPSGHVLIRVELLEQMERQVKLWCFVQDSGIGLSQEQIETLFQAFAQGDASTTRRYGGTGLGLSISRRLVELMGGTITVQSAPGQGSTFAFSAVFTVANTPSEALRPASDILRGLRALVVDDNPVVREVLVEQLWSLGLEAGAVDSGAAALEELQRRSRDLVLMDWRMPGMDGIEAIGRILALPALDPVPKIILLTAFGREEVLRGAQEAGASGFLLKPVTPRLLLEALMEAVGGPSDTIHGLDRELYVAPGTLRGRRVLVVDDNSINLEVALEILKGWGITGTQALSGREAIRILESESFDAVLMDVQMPDMDGYQTTGLIRQMPAHLDLPILAMTANAMERDRLACLEAGMNDFIPKPIEPEHLFAALLQWTPKEPPVPVPPQEPEPPAQPPPPVAVPGAADEGTPKAPLLDLDSALRRLGGNRTLLQELLQSFQRGHAQAATEIRAALDQGNAKQAEHLSHKVRGVAGNLGANRIMDLAGAMEKALRADDLASARNLLEPFSQALDATCDLIADTLPPQ